MTTTWRDLPEQVKKERQQVMDRMCEEFSMKKVVRHRLDEEELGARPDVWLWPFEPSGFVDDPLCAVIWVPREPTFGLGGSDCFALTRLLAPLGISVFMLDTSSASPAGTLVDDIKAVVKHLKDKCYKHMALWASSTGGTAALCYAMQELGVHALICDGCYSDLPTLYGAPRWMTSNLLELKHYISQFPSMTCNTAPNYDPTRDESQAPIEMARCCFIPAFFIHGTQDESVPWSHSKALRDAYGGEAYFQQLEGATQTSERPKGIMAKLAIFLIRAWQISEVQRVKEQMPMLETDAAHAHRATAPSRSPGFVALEERVPGLSKVMPDFEYFEQPLRSGNASKAKDSLQGFSLLEGHNEPAHPGRDDHLGSLSLSPSHAGSSYRGGATLSSFTGNAQAFSGFVQQQVDPEEPGSAAAPENPENPEELPVEEEDIPRFGLGTHAMDSLNLLQPADTTAAWRETHPEPPATPLPGPFEGGSWTLPKDADPNATIPR